MGFLSGYACLSMWKILAVILITEVEVDGSAAVGSSCGDISKHMYLEHPVLPASSLDV